MSSKGFLAFVVISIVNTILMWLLLFVIFTQVNQNIQAIADINARGFVPIESAVTKDDLDQVREDISRLEKMEKDFEEHLEFDDKKLAIQKK